MPQCAGGCITLQVGSSHSPSTSAHQGYVSGLLGNTLMCTHFASRGERSAVNVQLIGIFNNMLVLSQVGEGLVAAARGAIKLPRWQP